jgi:hypothetical protein
LKNPSQKIGLVEWLKVKALNSSPSATHTHKKKSTKEGWGMAQVVECLPDNCKALGSVSYWIKKNYE